MAHLIEPVTCQRDDQAWLMNNSRKVSPLSGDREPLGAVASGRGSLRAAFKSSRSGGGC
ncbi:hypothetical protein NOF04DRAFT_4893 [Fusarium oxysporum II5]|uniref:Uncharacterized protein n=2 Tax=Fusarium oxysporum species complex TaxID=171631 RepID=X0IME1_FUSO5|nr:uncharacterized protein FOIG_16703 [Fusarium odoratissimum NRRL 54006]EXL90017.1 hypothetical protein FOIG_16703 [Fusarium odoratissimum NRRL 54006]KAK2134152.1 hypothetical protein NOF04DRAFT_4893 [Fusarium oxysporum II5]TXB96510.1 hypothetical protein FocTR4_00012046 [Fusarium oxysporum f. sp. cubense]